MVSFFFRGELIRQAKDRDSASFSYLLKWVPIASKNLALLVWGLGSYNVRCYLDITMEDSIYSAYLTREAVDPAAPTEILPQCGVEN